MEFENMSCEELWDFVVDENNNAADRTAALSYWDNGCSVTWGVRPFKSGGGAGYPPRPPF